MAGMYCPACREPARFPWQHSENCTERPQHQLRWFQLGIPLLIFLLFAETVLLLFAFKMIGRCL